jgi:hypothetical protein
MSKAAQNNCYIESDFGDLSIFTKVHEISKAIFLETSLPKERPNFFEGFLP